MIRFGLLGLLLWRTAIAFTRLRRRLYGERVRWRERDVIVEVSRDKNSIERVCVGVELPDRFRFVLRREGELDSLAKWLHLAEEIQTGDARFDAQVFVVSEDDPLRRALVADAELRRVARTVLDDPQVSSVRCNEGRLWVECTSELGKDAADHDAYEPVAAAHLADLDAIVARLAAARAPEWNEARGRAERYEHAVYVICVALGIGAFASFFWSAGPGFPQPLTYERAERAATFVAIATACLLAAVAVLRLGGTPRLHLVMLEIVLAAGPGAWFCARTALSEYDMRGAQPPARTVLVRIEDREIVRGRRGRRSHYLTLAGWPDARAEVRLQVPERLYHDAEGFDCLAVRYSGGRIGDPWIADPVPRNCDAQYY